MKLFSHFLLTNICQQMEPNAFSGKLFKNITTKLSFHFNNTIGGVLKLRFSFFVFVYIRRRPSICFLAIKELNKHRLIIPLFACLLILFIKFYVVCSNDRFSFPPYKKNNYKNKLTTTYNEHFE